MIDLADPKTDVIKLFKSFKKYSKDYTVDERCQGTISRWLANDSYKNKEACYEPAKQLLWVWEKLGLIKVRKPSHPVDLGKVFNITKKGQDI
jgi:hypothetical protein